MERSFCSFLRLGDLMLSWQVGDATKQDTPLLFPLPVLDSFLVGVLLRLLSDGLALHVQSIGQAGRYTQVGSKVCPVRGSSAQSIL